MSETISNLKEFLHWRGFGEDEARYWARCFYKYTACGPWAVFLMTDQQAVNVEHVPVLAQIVEKDGQAVLRNPEELPEAFVSFLGFDANGLSKQEREWPTYLGLIDDYLKNETKMDRCRWPFEVQYRGKHMLTVRLRARTEHIPAVLREIYYEDIGRTKDDGSVITVDPDLCAGIKFGSIVEGSDCYSGPFEHLFPFKKADFERDEKWMEEETSFYWERDNSQWYEVVVNGKDEYYLHDTWGEIKWDSKPPSRALRKKIEEFVKEHYNDIPSEPHLWGAPKPDWEPLKIPGTRAVICERINDTVFE